jgi:ABC-2 type transport system ATP-binding protein
MADRVGVMHKGELILVEEKAALMNKMGRKELRIQLVDKLDVLPPTLAEKGLQLVSGGNVLRYEYDTHAARSDITPVLNAVTAAGIGFNDLDTSESSLEEIFVSLVKGAEK